MRRRAERWALVAALSLAISIGEIAFERTSSSIAAPAGTYGKSEVDRATIGVDDVLEYSLTVTSSGDASPPRSPAPGSLDGFELVGSSTSTQKSYVISNGLAQSSTSITVTYRLRATTIGVHVLGPGKMFVDGAAVKTPSVTVSVVAAGKAPPPPKKNALDPFLDDPFFGGSHDDEPPAHLPDVAPIDPMAAVTEVPAGEDEQNFFVRVVPNDRRPIVGQQVTTKLFVYTRRHQRLTVKRPPAFSEFALIDLGQLDHEWHPLTIAGDAWSYADIGAFAVFPLKTGSLTIGSAEIEYAEAFAPVPRQVLSKEVTVESIEPPTDGRPPAYVLGDVAAELEMNAEISPREVQDGHALLTLKLRGKGRLEPLRPILPTLTGVTWTPTGDDTKTELDGTSVRGVRKVLYDVAFDRVGPVDLDDALVHVWDPRDKRYATVHASLGRVRVIGAVPPAAAASASPLAKLPPPRREEGEPGTGTTLADHLWIWGLVFGSPIMVVLAQGATRVARRAKLRAAASRERPESQSEIALREARDAEKRGDRPAAMTAIARAVDRALEASTGIRARSLTGAELAQALVERRVGSDLARRITDLLAAIDSARFAGGTAPTSDEAQSVITAIAAIPTSTGQAWTPADQTELVSAVIALDQGRADEAIGKLEALADRGVVGSGIAFDRGLAYAARARGGLGLGGDLGRSAHAFEEALRREPHDSVSRSALDEIRKEIARRDVAAGWRAEEVGAPPMWRALVIAAPGNVWTAVALVSALSVSIALALRPRARRGLRLAASTVAIGGFVVTVVSAALGLGARYLRAHIHEAVVVSASTMAKRDGNVEPLRLVEGTRVDVLEERLTEAHVRMEKGDGWVPRSALRALPPYRP